MKWSATKLDALVRKMEAKQRGNQFATITVALQDLRECRSERVRVKQKRTTPRKGPMRDTSYRRWVREEWCVISVLTDGESRCQNGGAPSDPAHTANNGTSSKGPDSSCAPLCRKHHAEYDSGRASFEKKYGVDMKKIAAEHYARYLAKVKS